MTQEDLQAVVGWDEDAADAILAPHKMFVRVAVEDGEQKPLTAEYRANRVNVATRKGIIVKVLDIG